MKKENKILIYDTETNSKLPEEASLKWFGAYSYTTKQYYLFDYTQKNQIQKIIDEHNVFIGFNNKSFDNVVIENYGISLEFKQVIDLWEISAPRGNGDFGKNNKNRLVAMGIKLKNFTLKNIAEVLKLDDFGKGDIDYNIFMKDTWTEEEKTQIKKYLKQDIELTKRLYEWYETQFAPLKKLLPEEEIRKFKHIKISLASLAYHIICHKAALPIAWTEEADKVQDVERIAGGHHIDPREEMSSGNIVYLDFTSAYPHALLMGNLFSLVKPEEQGWNGQGFYELKGKYNNKEQGKIENAIKEIFLERLSAKRAGDKIKAQAYKIVINSIYGLANNQSFKSIYNPITPGDCTHIVRTWIKKLAKTIEESGFRCLYGFTDSIMVKIPKESSKEELLYIVNKFIEKIKSTFPFPMNTFGMEVEHELKFVWFVEKKHNKYLWVDNNNEIQYKQTLLNTNTPLVVMRVFDEYIKPKIVKELDVNFTEKELKDKLLEFLEKDIQLAAVEYKVSEKSQYKVKTSIHYQISDKYGEGRHLLIPNSKGIGIGRGKDTKKNKATRHCSIEDFRSNDLAIQDIDLKNLMVYFKPFYKN